jgi:glycosyltransferase involved in cell wall biosynthesis
MAPTVSVILPTFNRLQYLRPAVDSVFTQTFKDWELVIADDGSEGETAAYLARLADLPCVRVLMLRHTGNPSAVRNAALREARGRYVAFLDSDDLWLPSKLDIQLASLAASSTCRWSYTALTRINAVGEPMRDGLGQRWMPYQGAIFKQLLTFEAAVATPSVLAERSLVEEAGGFDEEQRYFEDYDLWFRLSLLSNITLIDEPLIVVRNHQEHYSADRISVYEARFRLLDKVASYAGTEHLRSILRMERAKNAASLALVSAVAGRRTGALKMLWRSRAWAWHREWWQKACVTVSHALAPSWLREAVRQHRRRRRALASGRI